MSLKAQANATLNPRDFGETGFGLHIHGQMEWGLGVM
jgi:hypothetical protein